MLDLEPILSLQTFSHMAVILLTALVVLPNPFTKKSPTNEDDCND